ncbi:hypothetical protein [Variovorax terrae]|uniref:Uncharacterized protein n=1 Tax=Variovorax terrae TaxID=2923278 RepID=A0A9X1W3Z7_9BURK|nr:hypothetical protein [Variovorax terrae]MCJ0765368.1 hypothetical protein [Variovorax terrae]
MFLLIVFWILGAVLTALGIALDMHRMRVNSVGISLVGWLLATACLWPAAAVAYMWLRPAVRRRLINAVWRYVGDATQPMPLRRARLLTLWRSGLIGSSIFSACLKELGEGRTAFQP